MGKILKLMPELENSSDRIVLLRFGRTVWVENKTRRAAKQTAEGIVSGVRAQPNTPVAADGFFCPQQIINGDFARPKHIAHLLCAALDKQ